ncbi:MAG: oxygen-independent coproporphyrinogen III oxidase [Deltaproteobacteria bacterium]|nr:oxygen-independent coproporphyrinogen III oxidase [Deltaproteobacteria bacterium]
MSDATETICPAADAQDPRHVDPELLRRYDVRGPRYTSYPPANHFADIDAARVAEAWAARRTLEDDKGLALYLHVPFCAARCAFCGCHTATDRTLSEIDLYVDALRSEMEHAADIVSAGRIVRQVAIGGGTPNFLGAGAIERLLAGMDATWRIAKDAERSVEIDPRTATAEKIERFVAHGFNRFSLGVQDLDDSIIGPLRPGANAAHVRRVVGILRANGIEGINFDLIYGLPGQTVETMTRGAEALVELAPTRVALYSYAHVPWLHPHQEALAARGLPGAKEKLRLFLRVMDVLHAAGYVSIGMDHFARVQDPLARAAANGTLHRNFMGYTTKRGLDLVAFGASGISAVGPVYSQNVKDTAAYLAAIAEGRLPVSRGFFLTRDDEIRRELLLDVFCNFKVDLTALGRRFGIDPAAYFAEDLARLAPMAADGMVEADASRVAVTPRGRFFVRNVCMAFDRHLEAVAGEQLYSRTV